MKANMLLLKLYRFVISKIEKTLGFLMVALLFGYNSFGQQSSTFVKDSLQGIEYFNKADTLYYNPDSLYIYSHKAIPLLKKTKQWDKYVSVLCGLNYYYNTQELYKLMERNNLLAFQEAQFYLKKDSETYIQALLNYALTLSQIKEEYLNALVIYKKAYRLANEHIPSSDPNSTISAIEANMGDMYFHLGDFSEALKFYKKSFKKYSDKEKLDDREAKLLHKIANSYFFQGETSKAKLYQLACLDTLSNGNYDDNFLIRMEINLIGILISNKEESDAVKRIKKIEERTDLKPLQLLKLYHNKAKVYLQQANFKAAVFTLKQAENIKVTDGKVIEKSKLLRTSCRAYFLHGNYRKAIESIEKAIKLHLPSHFNFKEGFSENQGTIELYYALKTKGELLFNISKKTKDEDRKKETLKKALKSYENLSELTDFLRSFYRSFDSEIGLLGRTKDYYENAISTSFQLFDLDSRKSEYLDKAFFFAEKSKSALLLDELNKKLIVEDEYLEELYNSQIEINRLKNEIEKTTDRDSLSRLKSKKEQDFADLDSKIKRRMTAFNKPVSIAKVQASIPQGSVLIEYFLGENGIYVFALNSEDKQLIKISNDFHLDSLLEKFHKNMKMSGQNGIKDYSNVAYEIYERLLYPVSMRFEADHLIIIPDGNLENIPFDILISDKKETAFPKKLSYLIHKYSISYGYSATVLYHQNKMKPPEEVSIFGVFPVFENTDNVLRFSKDVYDNLSSTFYGDFLYGHNANEKNFRDDDYQSKHSILHLSTHARGRNNASPSFDLHDATLELHEISNKKSSVHMAVLSACETNLGEFKKGEGVMSLTRGLAYAGIPSFVTSVSKVKDRSTSILMINFYKNLSEGMPKHEALRNAKIGYLNQEDLDDEKFAPYYWGSFMMIGNVEPLVLNPKPNYLFFILLGSLVLILIIRKAFQPRRLKD